MNKIFAAFCLIFSPFSLVQAQNGYVKYNAEAEYRDKTIKVLKGEILPLLKTTNADKVNIIIGKDTITGLAFPSNKFDTIQNVNLSYLPQQEDLVQIKKDGFVYINARSISPNDTVTLISEKGNQVTQLIKERETQADQSDCGKYFRLLITNTPTIYYNSEKLKQFVEPETSKIPQIPTDNTEQGFFESLLWWEFLLIISGLFLIAFFIRKFIIKLKSNKRNKGEPKFIKYNNPNKSFTDIANENNMTLDELLKLNREKINKKYKTFTADERKQVQQNLRNENLIVGYHEIITENSEREEKVPGKTVADDEFKESASHIKTSNFKENGNISEQLNQLERNLLNAIQKSGSTSNDNTNQLNSLNTQIQGLKIEKNNIEVENKTLANQLADLQAEKKIIDQNLKSVSDEKNKIANSLSQLEEKLVTVDYLSGYCDSVLTYFKLCDQVLNDAFNFFDLISKHDLQQANGISYLLLNFQNSVKTLPVGNWKQILQDIKDTGLTNNKLIRSSFKQLDNPTDRKREFQRLLFSEVLVKYSSSILILTEAFSHIGHFQVSPALAKEAQNSFAKHVTELISKVKSTSLENKYVPLFKNFEEFAGFTELANKEKSSAYKGIVDIPKESIIEIVSYGVKTPFEETKTLIILA